MGGVGGYDSPMFRFVLGLATVPRPRLLYVPTAVGDDPAHILDFHEATARLGLDSGHLRLFGVPDRPLERIREADVVVVNGGNTANMLAVWRVHGVDEAFRAALERGAILAGWSAGANCWFEASVTDSFRAELDPLPDGVGLLAGSFCPHYDGEGRRRPVYERLVADGVLPPGHACDDAAALHYHGGELIEAVAAEAGASAWRVDAAGSTRVETRVLS
jgi:peptidase E